MTATRILNPALQPEMMIRYAMDRIQQLEAEIRRLKQPKIQIDKHIKVYQSNRLIKVAVTDILFIKAESNYSYINMKNGERYYVSKTLKTFIKEMDECDFVRCHRSFFVNKNEIGEIDRAENEIVTNTGQRIPISRRHQKNCTDAIFKIHSPANGSIHKPECTVRKLG